MTLSEVLPQVLFAATGAHIGGDLVESYLENKKIYNRDLAIHAPIAAGIFTLAFVGTNIAPLTSNYIHNMKQCNEKIDLPLVVGAAIIDGAVDAMTIGLYHKVPLFVLLLGRGLFNFTAAATVGEAIY